MQRIILVSRSPRRKKILKDLGLIFSAKDPKIKETIRNYFYLKDLKKVTIAKINRFPEKKNRLYIACDTIVVYNGRVFGKPKNKEEAATFLKQLSNKKHKVVSCLAVKVVDKNKKVRTYKKIVTTNVWFRKLSEVEIERYTNSNEPYDKAGGYGIQEKGGLFVRKISGSYFNVIGLPVKELIDILNKINKRSK